MQMPIWRSASRTYAGTELLWDLGLHSLPPPHPHGVVLQYMHTPVSSNPTPTACVLLSAALSPQPSLLGGALSLFAIGVGVKLILLELLNLLVPEGGWHAVSPGVCVCVCVIGSP